MKRITTLLAGSLAGALGFTSVAFADTTIYGSVRSGIIHQDSEGSTKASWDLGSVDAGDLGSGDRLWSRIGVKASHDLGNGMTGGLHIEKRLDNFRTRHQNVYLSGDFGKITLGQQGTVYHPAASWDGSYLFGGNKALAPNGSRAQGVRYSSALGGPFNFSAMISDDNDVDNNGDKSDSGGRGDGLDIYEVSASFTLENVASVSVGYVGQDDGGKDAYGGTVGGSITGFDWKVGYEKSNATNAETRYGAFASYGGGYVLYEDYNTDDGSGENDFLILGYSRSLGTNTRVILEHARPDTGMKSTALVLRVAF